MRVQPALRVVPAYPDDPVYIAALAQSYRDFARTLSFTPDALLVSFHGLPQSYADKGDPTRNNARQPSTLSRQLWPKT